MNRSAFLACITPREAAVPDRVRDLLQRLQPALALLVDRPGLVAVGDAAAARIKLAGGRGIYWGHVFDRKTFTRVTDGGERLLRPPNEILRTLWGGYVAIRSFGDMVEVLRDPSGTVACYYAQIDGAHLITSKPDLLFDHGLLTPSIDWSIVAQSLVYRDLRPARTALRNIDEVLPGVALEIRGDRAQSHCCWSPWFFAQPARQTIDPTAAADTLRTTLTRAISAWSDSFQTPIIELSGGLDSSIVAAAATRSRSTLCMTFGPADGDPDERPWARAVAARTGLSLQELVPDGSIIDLMRTDSASLPRPCGRALSQAFDGPLRELAQHLGADAFLGGGGGDSVFCFLHSALPVNDRLAQEGFRLGLLTTAADIAQLARTNVWTVLLTALRYSMQPASRMPKPMTNPFLADHVRESTPWPAGNPWIEAPAEILPGKRRHVWSILAIQNHLEGHGREMVAPLISPLMSQPVLETCIGIPTWMWCEGGNNRAVARTAFRDLLPTAIVDRRTKVAFTGIIHRLVRAQLPALREILFSGTLARENMLDTKRLEAFLQGVAVSDDKLPELMALVEVEAWSRHWEALA